MVMLRSITQIARQTGADLSDPQIRLQCLTVLSLGEPTQLEAMESAYISSRIGLAVAVREAAAFVTQHTATSLVRGESLFRKSSQIEGAVFSLDFDMPHDGAGVACRAPRDVSIGHWASFYARSPAAWKSSLSASPRLGSGARVAGHRGRCYASMVFWFNYCARDTRGEIFYQDENQGRRFYRRMAGRLRWPR